MSWSFSVAKSWVELEILDARLEQALAHSRISVIDSPSIERKSLVWGQLASKQPRK